MKQNFTPSWKKFGVLSLLMTLLGCVNAGAQINHALTATVAQPSNPAATQTCTQPVALPITVPPFAGYTPCLYIDNVIPGYGTNPSSTTQWSFVSGSGNSLYFTWPAPGIAVNKIVFHKEFRPLVSANIEVKSAGVWSTVAVYNNYTNIVADSVFFPTQFDVDSIKISNINQGASGTLASPNFREIQIWQMPDCFNGNTQIQASYNGSTVTTPLTTSFTNVCPSAQVYLSATSGLSSVGHGYQWQVSNAATGPWTSIPGATNPGYVAIATGDHYYRVVDTCLAFAVFANSPTFRVAKSAVVYQTAPYFMGFDPLWQTVCATGQYVRDVPGAGWGNTYASGNNSWRVDSLANTFSSGWSNVTGVWTGTPAPTAGFPSRSARSHTTPMLPGATANLDLYMDLSTTTGDKQLSFYMINLMSGVPGGDSLRVLLSTDNGISWTRLAAYDTAGRNPEYFTGDPRWRRRVLPIQSNSATTIIRFQTHKTALPNNGDQSDIGIDSVYVTGPCSGMPNAGNINMASTINACPGVTYTLSPTGTTNAGGLVYTWEKLTNGCVIPDANVGGSGSNTLFFTTPPIYDTICYRLKVSCGTDVAYTNTITFNVPEPQYAALPFTENFETWITRCATSATPAPCTSCQNEVPSVYWANAPVTGPSSWRADNTTTAASGWSNVSNPPPAPFPQGVRVARFHSTNAVPVGMTGSLDLFVNCASAPGTKELYFQYVNLTGNDSLRILMSTNGGLTFTKLAAYASNSGWTEYMIPIVSNSATTVIRFQGVGDGVTAGSDIGIDKVVVLPPCTAAPNPGTISNATPCPGTNFTINLQGSSQTAGLTYFWEYNDDTTNAAGWLPTGSTGMSQTDNITNDRFYRVTVTCTNSGVSVTTPVKLIEIADFYYCYCNIAATTSLGADVGNFTVRHQPSNAPIYNEGTGTPLINNGAATATYTDRRWPIRPLIPLYHDSTYRFIVTQINSGAFTGASVSIWLDTSHNGVFEQNEQIMFEGTSASSNPAQQVDTLWTISPLTRTGITGLRIMLESPPNNTMAACQAPPAGEVEDYLVDIRYHPCNGPADAGTAFTIDSSSCPNYLVTLYDTSHVHELHNISWLWEYSPDGNSWAVLPNSQMKDTVEHILTGETFFRLRMLCIKQFSVDTTYSNVQRITINPPYACYCYSLANGGFSKDSSDLGAFTLIMTPDTFSINLGGPHLLNVEAYRARTDYTKAGDIELWVNETYPFLFYHIMKGGVHADAKITMFMDFNNDLEYDVTPTYSERIFTGYSTSTNFVVTGSITIPPYAIPNMKSGMRIIINNDVGPNVQSDSACGPYVSGETEDFVVVFRDPNIPPPDPNAVAGIIGNISRLYLYPNPTEGRFNVTFTAAKAVEKVSISVTNMLGQKVMEQQYSSVGKEFTRELNLTGMAKGVYLVEIVADEERSVRRLVVQ